MAFTQKSRNFNLKKINKISDDDIVLGYKYLTHKKIVIRTLLVSV